MNPKKKKLYFIRHCKTSFNENDIISGDNDIDIIQGERVIVPDNVRFTENTIFLSSPLHRCIQTSILLREKHNELGRIIMDSRLKERNMGLWKGQEKDKIIKENPDLFKGRNFIPIYTPPEGENFEVFHNRCMEIKREIYNYLRHNDVIVCSHNQTLKMLYCIIREKNIEEVWSQLKFENGVIFQIEYFYR